MQSAVLAGNYFGTASRVGGDGEQVWPLFKEGRRKIPTGIRIFKFTYIHTLPLISQSERECIGRREDNDVSGRADGQTDGRIACVQ